MKNKTLLLALVMMFTMVFSSVALASDVMPIWDNTHSCQPVLTISGSKAYCSFEVEAELQGLPVLCPLSLQEPPSCLD